MKPQPFTTLSGVAAALPDDNIDTDIIFPARFLLITAREGLGQYAFHDRRFAVDGSELPGFVLNQEPFRDAPILVAGANFGCGSSREQAVWALLGHGIRCIIAPSFGEIFHANCLRNGVLPITLPGETVAQLQTATHQAAVFTIDLESQSITVRNLAPIGFDIARERKLALANGWDDTDLILNQFDQTIAAFESAQAVTQPWLHAKDLAR